MIIDHDGLVVRAPPWVSIRDIELALTERTEWVLTTLVQSGHLVSLRGPK